MDAVPIELVSPPAQYASLERHRDCYVTRVAYDLGDFNTKVVVARVNVCTKTVDQIISEHSYPLPFFNDVAKSDQLLFSAWMQSFALQTLEMAKTQAEIDITAKPTLLCPRTEHCAVASQTFRIAENSDYFTKQMSRQLGFPVQTLTQDEEAQLCYYGVLTQWQALNKQLPVVWDCTGTHTQLIFKDETDQFYSINADLDAHRFLQAVQKRVATNPLGATVNPLNRSQVLQALDLAKQSHIPRDFSQYLINERIAHHAPIVGIGKIHNLSGLYWVQKANNRAQGGYSKVDLLNAIQLLTNQSDKQIQAMAPEMPAQYIPSQLTNLILLVATMEKLHIDWVEVLDTQPVWGVLLTGCR